MCRDGGFNIDCDEIEDADNEATFEAKFSFPQIGIREPNANFVREVVVFVCDFTPVLARGGSSRPEHTEIDKQDLWDDFIENVIRGNECMLSRCSHTFYECHQKVLFLLP